MSAGFSLFRGEECEQKSTSPLSPERRKVFKARRSGNSKMDANEIKFMQHVNYHNQDSEFKKMSDHQYMKYQKQTMPKRMKRKRKFDVFSSGSNLNLIQTLRQADTFRVPYHALFYVRANQHTLNEDQDSNTNSSNISQNTPNGTSDAFKLMMDAMNSQNSQNQMSQSEDQVDNDEEMKGNEEANDNGNQSNIFYPIKEECSITRDVRVQRTWVSAYKSFDAQTFDSNEKIHEYQINASHGIILADLDNIKNANIDLSEEREQIEKWVVDNRYSGFILNGIFHFYQPHFYWHLIDDNKRNKVKQTLISDMFASTKSKPTHSPWKGQFT